MNKRIIYSIFVIVAFFCVGCNSKSAKTTTTNINENEPKKATTISNYTGECGYIMSNQVYDYSGFNIETYEHREGICLPFPLWDGAKLEENSNGLLFFTNVEKDSLLEYLDEIKQTDAIISDNFDEDFDVVNGYECNIFKDNMKISFKYFEDTKRLDFEIYAGNVLEPGEFDSEDAKKMIEEKGLLNNNSDYEEYYIVSIQNDTVAENNFYEFLVFPVDRYVYKDGLEKVCYYMITDGKEVNYFSNEDINIYFPTNVNIIKDDKTSMLVISAVKTILGDGENTMGTVVCKYDLNDSKFEKFEEIITETYIHNDELSIVDVDGGKINISKLILNTDVQQISNIGNKKKWICRN